MLLLLLGGPVVLPRSQWRAEAIAVCLRNRLAYNNARAFVFVVAMCIVKTRAHRRRYAYVSRA